jgi:hypothetical protein
MWKRLKKDKIIQIENLIKEKNKEIENLINQQKGVNEKFKIEKIKEIEKLKNQNDVIINDIKNLNEEKNKIVNDFNNLNEENEKEEFKIRMFIVFFTLTFSFISTKFLKFLIYKFKKKKIKN